MIYELQGTHETDPLYILLAQEDEVEAENYAASQDAWCMQQNIAAEIQTGGVDFGYHNGISCEEDSQSDVPDAIIVNLLDYLQGEKK